jgi:dTDP-4-amino-4,6-dideoxygalactose transaminase
LHSAPAGRRFGRTATAMTITDRVAETLIRLPIHDGLQEPAVDRIVTIVYETLSI